MPAGFRLCTVLWGDWHVNAFLRYCLPTLLAQNNIPAVAAKQKGNYTIVTSPSDAAVIKASPVFASLQRHMAVDIVVRDANLFKGNFAGVHDHGWRITAEYAKNANQWMAFIAPDVCWSDGGLMTISKAFDKGKLCVFLFHHRVAFETFPEDFERFRRSTSEIVVSAPELAVLALRHLSPLVCSYFRDSRHMPNHAEYVYFPVPGEGALLRSIVTQPWAYDPTRVSFGVKPTEMAIPDPEQMEFITNCDEFVNVSMTPTRHQIDWYFEQKRLDVLAEALIGNQFYGYAVEHLWRVPFVLHSGPATPNKWQQVRRQSDVHMAKAYLALTATNVLTQAKREGCQAAAGIVAAALTLKAFRRFPRTAPLSILLPSNQALDANPHAFLLASEHKTRLRDLIMRHILLGDLSQPDVPSIENAAGDYVSVSRGSSVLVGDAKVLREVGATPLNRNLRLYEIDKVMQ